MVGRIFLSEFLLPLNDDFHSFLREFLKRLVFMWVLLRDGGAFLVTNNFRSYCRCSFRCSCLGRTDVVEVGGSFFFFLSSRLLKAVVVMSVSRPLTAPLLVDGGLKEASPLALPVGYCHETLAVEELINAKERLLDLQEFTIAGTMMTLTEHWNTIVSPSTSLKIDIQLGGDKGRELLLSF